MVLVTQSEVEELQEHFSSRPDIWISHNNVWVRKIEEDQYAVALSFKNGLAERLCIMTVKPVLWSQRGAEEYASWLLDKYTSTFTLRQQIIQVVREHKGTYDSLARSICELRVK